MKIYSYFFFQSFTQREADNKKLGMSKLQEIINTNLK